MSSALFSSLDNSLENRKRWGMAFMGGLVSQAVMLATVILFGLAFPEQLPISGKQYTVVWLPALRPAAPAVKLPQKHFTIPKPKPAVVPDAPVHLAAKLQLPKLRPTPPAVITKAPALPPPPPFVQAKAEPQAPKMEVHTGTFGGAPQPVTTKRLAEQVQTGGFGSPQGVRGEAKGESGGNLPKLGAFGLPEGPGMGNGTGGAHGIQGVVASAGFGSGVATAASFDPRSGSGVELGGFQKVAQVAPVSAKALPAAPLAGEFQPMELISRPAPVYTQEARQLGIQGDVALSVVFQANGAIHILAIVKSLGHGLDQAAEQAASQIRFRPAQRNGQPVDFPATLRIEFRLADQTT
jgi:TonB family protein